MAVHYILDGYNIIKRAPVLAHKNLRSGREGLIHMIEVRRPQGSDRNRVTIVFDGQPGMVDESQASLAKIVFTSGQSADDKIKSMVAASENKKNIIVVTDDREILFHVRALGATVLSTSEFLNLGHDSKKETGGSATGKDSAVGSKKIDRALERKIKQELEQVWLGGE